MLRMLPASCRQSKLRAFGDRGIPSSWRRARRGSLGTRTGGGGPPDRLRSRHAGRVGSGRDRLRAAVGDRRGDDGPPAHPGAEDGGVADGAPRRRRRRARLSHAAHRERRRLPRGNGAGAGGDAGTDRAAPAHSGAGRARCLADRARRCPDLHVRGLHLGAAGGRRVDRGRRDPGWVPWAMLGGALACSPASGSPTGASVTASFAAGLGVLARPDLRTRLAPGRRRVHGMAMLRTWIVLAAFGLPSDPGHRLPRPLLDGNRRPAADRGRHRARRPRSPRSGRPTSLPPRRRAWWSAPRRCSRSWSTQGRAGRGGLDRCAGSRSRAGRGRASACAGAPGRARGRSRRVASSREAAPGPGARRPRTRGRGR